VFAREGFGAIRLQSLCTLTRFKVVDPTQHGYIKYYFWTAQKAEE